MTAKRQESGAGRRVREEEPGRVPASPGLAADFPPGAREAIWPPADAEPPEIAVRRLSAELTEAQETLRLREAELSSLREDLAITRLLAISLRRSIVRSTRAIDQWRLKSVSGLGAWIDLAAIFSWRSRALRRTKQLEIISASGLFDATWYLERYPDVAVAGGNPLHHYIDYGAREGRDPHPLFDTDWYWATYPEVHLADINPLVHYLTVGYAQGFDPNPLFLTRWYRRQHADAADEKVNALLHYIEHAAEQGFNPNPYFDSAWYREQNPGVAATGGNPLVHYLRRGAAEGRDPHPSFDTRWYLTEYPRVANMRMIPLQHFLTIGAFEGCRPGPRAFDSSQVEDQEKGAEPEAEGGDQSPGEQADKGERAGKQVATEARAGTGVPPMVQAIDIMQWQLKLGRPKPAAFRPDARIGVFAHLFYDDMADEIAEYLVNIPLAFNVYVSTDSEEKKAAVEASFKRYGLNGRTVIKIMPNLGWDIAPFLLGFAEEFRRHDICLKIHAKKSSHHAGRFGLQWRDHLYTQLIGDPNRVKFVVDSFNTHPELGVLMAHHWSGVARNINAIGANYRPLRALLGRIGVAVVREQRIEFPSGSMFWFRGPALASLLEIGLTWEDFADCYANDLDATIAHAVERSVLFFAAAAGYRWAFLPRRRRWPIRRWNGRSAAKRRRQPA